MSAPAWLDLKQLVALLAGAVPTGGGWLIASWATERRERRRELWRLRVEVCRQVEEKAGIVHQRLSGWDRGPELAAELAPLLDDLARLTGQLPRYPDVQRAIAAFRNTAGWFVSNLYPSVAERQQLVAELTAHRDQLLAACIKALER